MKSLLALGAVALSSWCTGANAARVTVYFNNATLGSTSSIVSYDENRVATEGLAYGDLEGVDTSFFLFPEGGVGGGFNEVVVQSIFDGRFSFIGDYIKGTDYDNKGELLFGVIEGGIGSYTFTSPLGNSFGTVTLDGPQAVPLPVPEVDTYLMMLAGLSLLGVATLRTRSSI